MTSKPASENKKPKHLDPCPVIEELGRCRIGIVANKCLIVVYLMKLGSQLYIGANWEDRPGVCDPRLTKLCFTTSDKSIK